MIKGTDWILSAILAGVCCSGTARSQDIAAPEEDSVPEMQSSAEKALRHRDAIVRLMIWSMLYLEKRASQLDRMPMEGVCRAFLESYIAVPAKLVEECPHDYRKVFWQVDAGNRAFLLRMEKEKWRGEDLRREYGVHVEESNALLLPVVSRYPLSGRAQQVERDLRKRMAAAKDREAFIADLMEQIEDVECSLPAPEKNENGSREELDGEEPE